MDTHNFIDAIRIYCRSGHGGAGCKHFARTKYNPNAGPDGGDGGRGGHIILKGNTQLWTLLHLRYHKNIFAEDGGKGSKNRCKGKDGKDRIIEVPLGTVVYDEATGAKEIEILHDREEKIWIAGGMGGLGNAHFATATNQAPEYAQPGKEGIEGWKRLELKLLADVGLVGFPNAGKSTLLSVLTAAKPKIANYTFTTLVPQLGIVKYVNNQSFCIADLPGIIEGASEGKGLGYRFLRHIERNAVLLILIAGDSKKPQVELATLLQELEKFNPALLHKDILVVISKVDMVSDYQRKKIIKDMPPQYPLLFVSSHTQKGLNELTHQLWKMISANE